MNAEAAISLISHKSFLSFAAYPQLPIGCPVPEGWNATRHSSRVDALVITTRNVSTADLEQLIRHFDDPFLPVISLVQDDRPLFDCTASNGTWDAWERAHDILLRLHDLPNAVRHSKAAEAVLLGRLYSRNTQLRPTYNPALLDGISYPAAGQLQEVTATADQLVERGQLERQFFDRMYVCPDCRSSILSVREECHSCRSPHLIEESIVHHFRCSHEASEHTFRRAGRFECPKCGDGLRHIGLDYDKPGSMLICQNCRAVDDTSAVGFLCIHCGRHHDAEKMPTRDWFSYQLTAKGTNYLLDGCADESCFGPSSSEFMILLGYASREQMAFGVPFQVLRLSFTEAQKIRDYSVRLWKQLQQLVRDGLHSALRDVDSVTEVEDGALILLPRTTERETAITIAHIRQRLSEILQVDPGVKCEVVPPSEIQHLLQGH